MKGAHQLIAQPLRHEHPSFNRGREIRRCNAILWANADFGAGPLAKSRATRPNGSVPAKCTRIAMQPMYSEHRKKAAASCGSSVRLLRKSIVTLL